MAEKEELSISSPQEDIAKTQILAIEQSNIEIKSIITKGLKDGLDIDELNKLCLESIERNGEALAKYPKLYETYLKGMKASTQRWFIYYTENLKVINSRTIKEFKDAGVPIGASIKGIYNNIDAFRPYVSNNAKGLAIIKGYEAKVKQELNKLVNDNPIAFIQDKNGNVRKRSLRNEAETQVRLEANREDVLNLKDKGVKFVVTTSHADCSKRCQPWQGRLYSLDGTSGNHNGQRYVPLQDAMEGENKDGNGIISGYNCRHRAVPYKEGMVAPKEYSQAFIRKQRQIDSKQRYYERSIRQLKVKEQLYKQNGYNDLALALRKKIEERTAFYKYYSLKNERAFYDWRTQIGNKEVSQILATERMIGK